jgi:hypothetical protein
VVKESTEMQHVYVFSAPYDLLLKYGKYMVAITSCGLNIIGNAGSSVMLSYQGHHDLATRTECAVRHSMRNGAQEVKQSRPALRE